MTKEREEMTTQPPTRQRSDQELDAAFKDLYRKYGRDVQAFMRDVQESLRKRRAAGTAKDAARDLAPM